MHWLITGASGQLGAYLLRELHDAEVEVVAWSGTTSGKLFGHTLRLVDLANESAVAAAFAAARPDVVIHAGAMAAVAECQQHPDRAWRVNVAGTATLARQAAACRARFLVVSTDLVFDGERGGYHEHDAPAPLSHYGRTKAAAEPAALAYPGAAVVRVSWLYGPSLCGRPTFFDQMHTALRERRPLALFEDEWRSPLSLAAAARALVAIARSEFHGLLHVGGPERLSRLEMGQRLASHLGIDPSAVIAMSRLSTPAPEPRPRDVSLDSTLWRSLFPNHPWPTWDEAVRDMNQVA